MGKNCVISHAKPIGVVAAISSGIQGLLWALFYLVILLQRYCVFSVGNEQSHTFKQYLVAYVTDEKCAGAKGVVGCVALSGPEILLPWLVIGVFGHLILAASSLALALVLLKCGKETHFAFINTWIFFGLVSFIVDAGLTFLFAVDFMKLQSSTCLGDRGMTSIAVAALLLMSTHGVLLTLANLAFIIFFFAVSVKLYIKYKIRNKEIDLVSDWPSASSENSLFDFYNNKTKSDVVGIVNPIQEYPEYSAKGRWPTLRESAEQTRPPLRAWESRSDIVDHSQREQEYNNKNLINQRLDQGTSSARMRKYVKVEPTITNHNKPQVVAAHGKVERESRVYSVPTVPPLPSHNSNPNKDSIRNSPSSFAPITPPAPPLPLGPLMHNPKVKQISSMAEFEASTKFFPSSPKDDTIKVAEPDYTPPIVRKPFDTVSGAPSGGPRQQSAAMMSLHEAIKSRPPLKPVLSRMKSTEC
ncbi:uncharacterized protein LOC111061952 [Nilaparvata lugens]|uniref:uncharacterized protein LOC111061952 n=1 Tax=Nilaparvata lugens TaxID=108931 RepID=UPI00193D8102|nr:uncharacterized protein LOC111061952 [Nilaparvata lugens]